MKTTLEIDKKLLEQAMSATGQKTMKATIEATLKEIVSRKQRKQLISLIGNMDLDFPSK